MHDKLEYSKYNILYIIAKDILLYTAVYLTNRLKFDHLYII